MKSKTFFAILLLIAGVLIVFAFGRLPIENSALAIDWKQIWNATHNFRADYATTELRTPPWLLPVIWVFTLFPLNLSWGLAAAATLAVLVLSVPRDLQPKRWLLGVVLLAASYPALRQVIDGNLEALVIVGVVLLLGATQVRTQRNNPWLLAGGLVLATAKIQETWIFLAVLAFVLWRDWPRAIQLKAIVIAAVFAAPFVIWKGGDWLNAMVNFPWPGTAIDSSLQAFATRLALPAFVYWIAWIAIFAITIYALRRHSWNLGRLEVGTLITAGLLLAPYAASNSVLVPLAFGVIPLLQRNFKLGIFLVVLYYLPFLALGRPDIRFSLESSYWTIVLIFTWAVSCAYLLRLPRQNAPN